MLDFAAPWADELAVGFYFVGKLTPAARLSSERGTAAHIRVEPKSQPCEFLGI
jgi:hypothetical protein